MIGGVSSVAKTAISRAMLLKNCSGFTSRSSWRMVTRMRKPSLKVDSLLSEPSGTWKIVGETLRDRHAVFQHVYGQFGFDLEAFGLGRKCFDEAA